MKNKKKLYILSYATPIGGNVTYFEKLAIHALKKNFEVTLLLFGEDIHIENKKIRVIHVGDNQRLLKSHINIFNLYSVLKRLVATEGEPDLVLIDIHRYIAYFQIVKQFIPVLKQTQFIYQFHGFDVLQRNFAIQNKPLSTFEKYKFWMEKKLISKATQIYCFSQYSQSMLKKHLPSELKKIKKINPGIGSIKKINRTKKNLRKKLGLPSDATLFLLIGRFETRKGMRQFLQLLSNQSHLLSQARFVIASNFNDPEIQKIKFPYSSQFYIFNNPDIKTKSELYTAVDCTLLTSLGLETFGFVTQESLALGTPVLGYDIGANKELLKKKYLASVKRPESLFRKIEWFLTHKKEIQKETEENAAELFKKYSWEKYASVITK